MIGHLFPDFLKDERVYAQAEQYWLDLWNKIDSVDRNQNGWKQPWFQPLPPAISEGNPIFSAFSPTLRRGIRVLQSEPTENGVELFAYPDTFGGGIFDPESINELVISCALSDVAARLALDIMKPWVANKPVSFESSDYNVLMAESGVQIGQYFPGFLIPAA